MKKVVRRHTDLELYKRAFAAAMRIFEETKNFPKEERYALVNQIRKCSRSVCGNLAEAWRLRRYPAAFVSKLSTCEGEVAETQCWLQFSVECGYLARKTAREMYSEYDAIIAMIVRMIVRPDDWTLKP
jgi:four helix bundle protein